MVSVIVPCYNKGELVVETIISLLEQDYSNFEIIIVDDGSTDQKTIRILDLIDKTQRELQGSAPIYIHKKVNGGLSSARNYGIKKINESSEFIIFLDNDDLLHPSAISLMTLCILHNPRAAYCYPDQMIFGTTTVWWQTQEYNSYDLLWQNHPSVCSIFRKNVIKSVQYSTDLLKGMEDYNLWLTLSSLGYQGVRLPLPVFEYRTSPTSMSANITSKHHNEIISDLVDRHSRTLYDIQSIDYIKRKWRPFVSVIITACEADHDLLRTLDSLQEQSSFDFEVLITSYCNYSNYHLLFLQRKHSFITQIIQSPFNHHNHNENNDNNDNEEKTEYDEFRLRNYAANYAIGDYLLFLQKGDLLLSTSLEKLSLFAYFTVLNLENNLNLESCMIFSSSYHENNNNNNNNNDDINNNRRSSKLITSNSSVIEWEHIYSFLSNPFLIPRKWFNQMGKFYDKRFQVYDHEMMNFFNKLIFFKCKYYSLSENLFQYQPINEDHNLEFIVPPLSSFSQSSSHNLNYNLNVFMYNDEEEFIQLDIVEEIVNYYHKSFLDNIKYTVNTGSFRRSNSLSPFHPTHWKHFQSSDLSINPPHILYLIPFMDVGGSEAVDLIILEALIENGFYVLLLTELPHSHPWRSQFEAIVQEIIYFNEIIIPAVNCEDYFDFKMQFLDYLVISRNIDVIFNRNTFIGYEYFQYKSTFNAMYNRQKHVYYCDLVHLYVEPNGAWESVSADNYEFLDRQFVISKDLRDFTIRKYRIPSDKFSVIYNGIDTKKWSVENHSFGKLRRDILHLPKDSVLIGLVARLVDQKDPIRWVHIAVTLAKRNSNYYFVMIGDGDLYNSVKLIISNSKLEKRIFLLGVRNDVAELMIDFDILLMTSKYEGVPIVMLEAMSLGIPIVSTSVGGISECVINDGIHGALLSVKASDDEFIQTIEKMRSRQSLYHFNSQTLRNHVVKHFEVSKMKRNYVNQVLSLVSSSRTHYSQRFKDYVLHKIDKDSTLYLDCS